MKRIQYPDDCKLLQGMLLDQASYELTLAECQEFWEWRSFQWSAQWLAVEEMGEEQSIREFFFEWLERAE